MVLPHIVLRFHSLARVCRCLGLLVLAISLGVLGGSEVVVSRLMLSSKCSLIEVHFLCDQETSLSSPRC